MNEEEKAQNLLELQTKTEKKIPNTKSEIQKEHYWRFINLLIFFLQHIIIGPSITGITSIAQTLSKVYKVDTNYIILSSSVLLGSNMIISIINAFVIEKFGLKNSNMLFSFLNVIGAILRCYMYIDPFYLLLGQFICGLGNSYLLLTAMRFFKNWFKKENIVVYFPFIAVAVFLGTGIGSILPFGWIDEEEQDLDKLDLKIRSYLWLYVYLFTGSFFLSVFFFREQPPIDFRNQVREGEAREGYGFRAFFSKVKELMSDFDFLLFVVIIGFGRGNLLMIFGLLNIFFTGIGLSQVF